MNLLYLCISLMLLTNCYFFYCRQKSQTWLLEQVLQHHPADWQQLTQRAARMGNHKKWLKLVTLEALKNGQLDANQNNTIQQPLLKQQRQEKLLIGLVMIEMTLGFIAASIA